MIATMNIGSAAKASGVTAKMIRHYEEIGLLGKVKRTDSGYRVYDENDVHSLRFVKRARDLGFSMKEIKKLLGLWKSRAKSAEVKRLAQEHLKDLETKIAEMKAMADAIRDLVKCCHGDARPECPILQDLAR